jgi:Dolichyl-phosphate-mannose-protein mannosyltransferase
MSQTLMEAAAPAQARAPALDLPDRDNALGPRWLPPLVLIGAIAVGIFVYAWFWQHSRELWWWMGHDRHAHYMYGLNLAFDLRTGDFVRLFHDFDRMRVWGPFHAFAVALVEMAAGPDHRLAVLPSLAGWILTIWCAFLIPRRVMPTGGNAAGLLAAFLVAVSPAHRALATDCMYESLGACLSLAAIYLYLIVLQDGTRRAAILLGLALTALFLHKYNYWLLVLFGLVLGEFTRQPRAWLQYALSCCQRDQLPRWLRAELKHPLNYVALAFAWAAVAVRMTGGGTIALGRWSMSAQEPHNFIHLAYIAFLIRLVFWWRQTGSAWSLELPPTLRTVLVWHGSAIALWFLLPKRLSYFLWYLSPYQTDQQRDSVPFMHGLPYYLQGLSDDYLPLSWGLYLFVGMLALGLLAWRNLKPGSGALTCFLLIAIYLTCQHPMLKNRFMHSWIAAAWIVGSVGLVFAVQQIAGFASRAWRPWAAGVACAVLIGMHSPAFLEPGHAQEGGLKPELPSPLRITDTYLPALADARNPTILSNVSARFLWTWTFIEHHHHQNFAGEVKNFKSYENNPEKAKHWLDTTRSDALVLIDIRPGTMYDWKTDEYVDLSAFKQSLAEQTVWVLSQRWEMPEGVTIMLWKR